MPQSTIKLLEDFAGYCAVKNKVIAKNIANIGTENYRRQDVVFKDVLNENMNSLLKTSGGKYAEDISSASTPKYEIITDNSQDKVSGVNNVDIDKEMADLAENNLNFSFAAKKIGDYYKTIDSVIQGNPV
ncbi:MAG: flagellar basal body rod protein FlgB [Ignavibacteriaceae bacterium]